MSESKRAVSPFEAFKMEYRADERKHGAASQIQESHSPFRKQIERASERSREIQAANRELRQLATPCRSLTVKPPPEEESTAVVHRSGWANTSLACGKGVLPDAGHFDSALSDFCGHPPVEILGNNSCSLEMFSHLDLSVDFLSCSWTIVLFEVFLEWDDR